MAHDIDLGGAPANEHCAQLGHTPGFAEINRFEVFAYKLALIARYGTPPEGCALRGHSNHHDFGTYRTLVLHVTDDSDTAVRAYAEKIEEGLGSWIEAGFTPPIHYDDGIAVIPREDPCELIIGALLTTRPDSSGQFGPADFETLHRNLTSAFPEQADAARTRLAQGEFA